MKPLVSVFCMTYNHEKYIKDALEGFVGQETDFPYEIIVHDDASTDKTPEIIREYADKYDIIKPIFQDENQYSKGINILNEYINPIIQGKYVAICEGDDYWCDKHKLQRQVDWLEENPDYSFCVHNTKKINMLDNKTSFFTQLEYDRDISVEEIIINGTDIFHTSSYLYRSEYKDLPNSFIVQNNNDYPRAIYLSLCGKVRFLRETMSVYRMYAEGSWTTRTYKSSGNVSEKIIERKKRINKMLSYANKYSEGRYSQCIASVIRKNEFAIFYAQNNIKIIKEQYRDLYDQMSLYDRLYMNIKNRTPYVLKALQKIKRSIKI